MSTTWQAVAGAVGAVVTIAGSYVVARVGARVSQHATDTTAELSKEANAIAGYHQLVEDLQDDVVRLRADHNELRRHVEKLESERARDKSLIRHLIAYIRHLRESWGAGGPIPDAPAGLDLEGGPLA